MHPKFAPLSTICALSLSLLLCACEESIPREPATSTTWIETRVAETPVKIQVALTPSERSMGLMHRKEMGEDEGMLFVFSEQRQLSFWMKNTHIPLDIAYITSNGTIREIYQMYPFNENSVPSRRRDLSLALEMNQGWFAENGISPGGRIDLEPVLELIKRRSMSPDSFSIQTSP